MNVKKVNNNLVKNTKPVSNNNPNGYIFSRSVTWAANTIIVVTAALLIKEYYGAYSTDELSAFLKREYIEDANFYLFICFCACLVRLGLFYYHSFSNKNSAQGNITIIDMTKKIERLEQELKSKEWELAGRPAQVNSNDALSSQPGKLPPPPPPLPGNNISKKSRTITLLVGEQEIYNYLEEKNIEIPENRVSLAKTLDQLRRKLADGNLYFKMLPEDVYKRYNNINEENREKIRKVRRELGNSAKDQTDEVLLAVAIEQAAQIAKANGNHISAKAVLDRLQNKDRHEEELSQKIQARRVKIDAQEKATPPNSDSDNE